MNQTPAFSFASVVTAAAAFGVFSSLCTIQAPANTLSLDGQPDLTSYSDKAGLVNLPCMSSPYIELRPNPQEMKKADATDTKTQRHVLLEGYFAGIESSDRAVVDGVAWDIIAIEPDSQQTQTRLLVQEYSL